MARSQLGLENQNSGKGQKTPQLPLLDLRRIGAENGSKKGHQQKDA